MRMRRVATVAALVGSLGNPAWAQVPPVPNPTGVKFTCPDHALDTGHEVDIISSAGVVIQTIVGGDPTPGADGMVTIPLNVQPIAFGTYTIKVRAMAGTLRSGDSPASDPWVRVPGVPSKPVVF